MSYGLDIYKKTSVDTASKNQILLMLYQAAIKNCRKSIKAIEDNNIAKKGEYIGKLQDIIIELNNSLDFSVDRNIAEELSRLYDFILYASTQANMNIDKKPLEGCLNVIMTLYDGWEKAIKSLKNDEDKKNNA